MGKPINSLFDAVMSMKYKRKVFLDTLGGEFSSGIIQHIENEGGKDLYIVTYTDGNSVCCKLI